MIYAMRKVRWLGFSVLSDNGFVTSDVDLSISARNDRAEQRLPISHRTLETQII